MFHEAAETVSGGHSAVPAQAAESLDVDGVPDVSAELYRAVLDAANAAPSWVQHFAVFFTEAGVVALGLMMVFGWWRARGESGRAMAAALLAPAATMLAYGISEIAKLIIEQDRPCRAVPGAVPLTDCPPVGDWSFPSNHSTIAGGAAMAVFLCRRGRLGVTALILGAFVALSRVVVGVHYPHDVGVGFGLGVLVATAVLSLVTQRVTPLVDRLRSQATLDVLLGPGGPTTAPERSRPEGEEASDRSSPADDADDAVARSRRADDEDHSDYDDYDDYDDYGEDDAFLERPASEEDPLVERSLPEDETVFERPLAENAAVFERPLPKEKTVFERPLPEDETSVLPATTRQTPDSAPTRLLPRTPHWPPELTDHDRWSPPPRRPRPPRGPHRR